MVSIHDFAFDPASSTPAAATASSAATATAAAPAPTAVRSAEGRRAHAACDAAGAPGEALPPRPGRARVLARAQEGLVISQKPRPGARLRNGAKVNVVVSKGRR